MRVLYGKLFTSKDELGKSVMEKLNEELTYYSDEGLFIPSWGDFNEVLIKLFPYWGHIIVTDKSFTEKETEELWKSHPEIWVRRPDLLPGFTAL